MQKYKTKQKLVKQILMFKKWTTKQMMNHNIWKEETHLMTYTAHNMLLHSLFLLLF